MLNVSIGAPAFAASSAMTRAALVLAVRPMTRPARWPSQTRANAAMTWVLPVPGRGHQAVDQAAGGQQARGTPPAGSSPGPCPPAPRPPPRR